jgi:hypothetical protein
MDPGRVWGSVWGWVDELDLVGSEIGDGEVEVVGLCVGRAGVAGCAVRARRGC